jgi:hypothetical protein
VFGGGGGPFAMDTNLMYGIPPVCRYYVGFPGRHISSSLHLLVCGGSQEASDTNARRSSKFAVNIRFKSEPQV